MGIVIGMHPDEIVLFGQPVGFFLRLGQRVSRQDHLCTMVAGRGDLHEWRQNRHDDGCRYAKPSGMIGNALGVVAGRNRNHSALLFIRRQAGELHQRTTFLEGAGDLHVFVFYKDIRPCELRKPRSGQARGLDYGALQKCSRFLNLVECDVVSGGGPGGGHFPAASISATFGAK